MRPGRMDPLSDLLGQSPGLVAVREQIRRLLERRSEGQRPPPILFQGETGTGKGLLARALHRAGPRAQEPFVDVNCAAIPETLLEAELFGYERGAFTDARQAKPGLFQIAHRGTLFLDEVGLLPAALQAKLLTVLEERAVRRLGSTRSEPADVWILAASNEDLAAATRARRFREDLYHRLAVLTLWLPPLRERGRDILLLAEHFLARAAADYGLPPKTLAPDAQAALQAYPWPGNVRELANLMERVALLHEAPTVTADMLSLPEASRVVRRDRGAGETLRDPVQGAEQERLLAALRETNWNISHAAARLGISRNTLRYRIEKFGLHALVSPQRARTLAERPAASGLTPPPSPTPRPAIPPPHAGAPQEQRQVMLVRATLVAPPAALPGEASRALEALAEKAQSFGGRVGELSPAGIEVTFGVEPLEDAPLRAAHAAMAMRNVAERARRGGEHSALKIGIHAGDFPVEDIGGAPELGPEARREAGAVLGSLLEQAEPGGPIIVSEAAAQYLKRRFELLPVDLPGQEPRSAYRLAGRGHLGQDLRRLATFVGRRHELELLQSRLASAVAGHGQVVGITGEAGIGKTRLLFEFRRTIAADRARYLEGHCLAYGSAIPYLPLLDLLRDHCAITDLDTPEAITEKVSAGLRAAGMDPSEGAPYLLQLLGVKEGAEPLALLSAEAIKNRTFEILRQLTLRGSVGRPLVLAVENLHWIDRTSEEYLASLVESMAGAPILLLLTYRPGYRPPGIEKSYATQIALQPLAEPDSQTLVQSYLDARLPEPMAHLILARAEGNPFFLEELALAVAEHADASPPGAVPDTIQEVLRVRIERLPDEPRRVLQTASVLGREFSRRLLGTIWPGPGAPDPHLVELKRLEFLYEQSGADAPAYVFKHGLTQQVAYESLPLARRQTLHAAAGRALETLYAGRLPQVYEHLAHHYARSERQDKAVEYALLAGDRAAHLFANAEAKAYYEQALTAVRALSASPETQRWEIDVILKLAAVGVTRQDIERDRENLEQARVLAETLHDDSRLARVLYWIGRMHYVLSEMPPAIDFARHSLEIAEGLGDETLAAPPVNLMGRIYWFQSDFARAGQMLERSVEQMRRLGNRAEEARAAGWAAFVFGMLGEFEAAWRLAEHGVRVAEELHDPFVSAAVSHFRGLVRDQRGEWKAAAEDYEAAWRIADQAGDLFRVYIAKAWEGRAYTAVGDPVRGLALIEESLALATKIGATFVQELQKAFLAACLLALGQLDVVPVLCQEAIGLAEKAGDRWTKALSLRTLGEAFSVLHPPDVHKAETALVEAMRLLQEIGAKPELARSYVGYARLLNAKVEQERAEEYLIKAIDMFQEMRMIWDLAQAEQALRELSA